MPSSAARTIYFLFALLLIWINSSLSRVPVYCCCFVYSFHIPVDKPSSLRDTVILIRTL